jgi:hypothetical protein
LSTWLTRPLRWQPPRRWVRRKALQRAAHQRQNSR